MIKKMTKIPAWIDTDTGVDDAIALVCAFGIPELEVVGISAVCGNQTVDKTYKNARDVTFLCGHKEVKVYKGVSKPLNKELVTSEFVHGENGLGGALLPESDATIEKEDAIDALYNKAKELNGQLVLIGLGPLSNIASCINKYPDFKDLIKEIVMMGGSLNGGNRTAYAEFNIFNDALAAKIVFDSGIQISTCVLDFTKNAYLTIEEVNEIRNYDNPCCKLFDQSINLALALYEKKLGPGMRYHDACTLFYLTNKEKFVTKRGFIYVAIDDEERYGQTVFIENEKGNHTVVIDGDANWLNKEIINIYKSY